MGAAPRAAAPAAAAASAAGPRSGAGLPDRRFDLPSLKAMNANLLVDIAHADLGTPLLDAIEPLRAHLQLQNGVLGLAEIEARTADGRLTGKVGLDGRDAKAAIWTADLSSPASDLDRWLHQQRKNNAPPWISGQLDGQVKVSGRGRSTAEILGTLEGGMRFHLRNGRLSHVALEVAGIDLAQALGVLVKGDETWPSTATSSISSCRRASRHHARSSSTRVTRRCGWTDPVLHQRSARSHRDRVAARREPVHGAFADPRARHVLGSPRVAREGAGRGEGRRRGAACARESDRGRRALHRPGANDEAKREAAACRHSCNAENPAKVAPTESARAAAAAKPRH